MKREARGWQSVGLGTKKRELDLFLLFFLLAEKTEGIPSRLLIVGGFSLLPSLGL